jgi:ligand-binding sensor domain-containing protein
MFVALIVCAILLTGCVSAPTERETQHWSCQAEVYELAWQEPNLYIRTSGGIFALRNGRVAPADRMPASHPPESVTGAGDGAFLSATAVHDGKIIASYWGGKSVFAYEDGALRPLFERPPAEGDYAMASGDGKLFAGTNRGLFRRSREEWEKIDLGGELPFPRVHGISKLGREFVIGGTEGAAIGKPSDWKFISHEAVRQIEKIGSDVWILYGSGAVDKLDSDGRLHSDGLSGTAKRPWTSVLGESPKGLFLGGHGGWAFKGKTFIENYPAELAGEVVTAISERSERLYVGTQSKGLAEIKNGKINWINPAKGLGDTWVTALVSHGGRLYASTATAGLYEIRNGNANKISAPSTKIRHLEIYKGSLAIGSLDGAWKLTDGAWTKLQSQSLETTCMAVIDEKLWIGTPSGIFIESLP